ncbi:uncharacterized protein B0I36DRAFT_359156 [Microdochium trichocladiopsis]|uniref:Uncharacterized protein n=1 Tax=Microdochium trichocladiopsis TaxID=1682393 RepID=A0A9P9BTX4_9PEZI|nr:uncharacterized protein B0I36DRAFT_359156 [Microdochium trichocladiopsis]KAH7037467.1 hypothetical protein B0I36DRAFT_359156 [Microdochium trichocladiopsis]
MNDFNPFNDFQAGYWTSALCTARPERTQSRHESSESFSSIHSSGSVPGLTDTSDSELSVDEDSQYNISTSQLWDSFWQSVERKSTSQLEQLPPKPPVVQSDDYFTLSVLNHYTQDGDDDNSNDHSAATNYTDDTNTTCPLVPPPPPPQCRPQTELSSNRAPLPRFVSVFELDSDCESDTETSNGLAKRIARGLHKKTPSGRRNALPVRRPATSGQDSVASSDKELEEVKDALSRRRGGSLGRIFGLKYRM